MHLWYGVQLVLTVYGHSCEHFTIRGIVNGLQAVHFWLLRCFVVAVYPSKGIASAITLFGNKEERSFHTRCLPFKRLYMMIHNRDVILTPSSTSTPKVVTTLARVK